jgi:hypothetical protein
MSGPKAPATRETGMAWSIGVDIGGTFTDVAIVDDATGRIGVAKAPTTPRDFAGGVLGALDAAMRRHGVVAADVGLLAHATTVVTNALLEEQGARAVMVATEGFRDVLELRRSSRADPYDLFQDAPAMLVPRHRRRLPRPPPRDLRPRQPRRAGADRQHPRRGDRRHSAAAHPPADGAARQRCTQGSPAGLVPRHGPV